MLMKIPSILMSSLNSLHKILMKPSLKNYLHISHK
jgi:hypothetical protein